MAGFQVGQVCYPTQALGLSAYAAAFVPSVVPIGTSCNGYVYLSSTGTSLTANWVRVSGTCAVPTSASVGNPLQACSQYEIADAASMSWQVAACWLIVFGVAVVLKRALQ